MSGVPQCGGSIDTIARIYAYEWIGSSLDSRRVIEHARHQLNGAKVCMVATLELQLASRRSMN